MLSLLIGRAGSGKSTELFRQIIARGAERPQILLVPEQASHETERRLCEAGGNRTSLYADVLSFTRLCNRVFSAAGGLAEPVLDAGGRMLLMHHALKSVAPRLCAYAKPSQKPAFLTGLLATVDELKSCCITPLELSQAAEELDGTEGDRLRDLSLICGAYDAFTAQSAMDPRDRLTRLAEKLDQSGWARGTDLYVDGFTDFTAQEYLILRELIKQCETVAVALTCDQLEEIEHGTGVFSPARHTGAILMRLAKEVGVKVTVRHMQRRAERPEELSFLEDNLFSLHQTSFAESPGALELFSAWTPRSEVEWTAARILELVREKGYRFREIAVVARSFDPYADLIDSVFRRYGVPVFITAMHDILQKPVLTLVAAALDAAANDYEYDSIFRYLKTGLTGLSADECDILENYVLKWNIQGSRWTTVKDWTMHPRGYGFQLTGEDRTMLAELNQLRQRVSKPLEWLRKNSNKTAKGQVLALYAFLEEIGLAQRLEKRTKLLEEQGERTLAQEYGQLWEILCGAMEQFHEILGEIPMELEEFSGLFQLILSQYNVGTIPVSLDRVTAGEVTRITNRSIKVLFFLGTDDGSIPQTASAPGLLTDDDRSLLASLGLELAPRLEEKLFRENTVLYGACTQPTERLILTWPLAGSEGEEKRPSFLIGRLKALFPQLTVLEEGALDGSFRLAAPGPALEQAAKKPELRGILRNLTGMDQQVQRLEQAERWERGRLSAAAVRTLYGKRVPMSASRMDKYKSCHFSYFMQYGLKAKPRRPAGFLAPEYGTFVHYVLEKVFREAGKHSDKATLHRLTRKAAERYLEEELGGREEQTARFRYLFRRLLQSVYLVVENVAEELEHSDFMPISFELGFGEQGSLPPVELTVAGVTLSISGFVDRVDGWVKDNRLFLRVIDYKTGKKSFDLTEIWNGIGLQMLLYLFTLEKEGKSLYNYDIVPAGVLYLPARDVIVQGSRSMSEETRRREVDRDLRRRGLLLDDPAVIAAMERPGEEGIRFLPLKVSASSGAITGDSLITVQQMGKLSTHIRKLLEEMCQELSAGSIAADPYWRGPEKNACLFCDYAAACQFEEGRGEDRRRYLPTLKSREFWASISDTEGEK